MMKRRAGTLFLFGVFIGILLTGRVSAGEEKPDDISSEDWEVIQDMDILEMLEMLDSEDMAAMEDLETLEQLTPSSIPSDSTGQGGASKEGQ